MLPLQGRILTFNLGGLSVLIQVNPSFKNLVKLHFSMNLVQTKVKHVGWNVEHPGRVKGDNAPPPRAYYDF